MISEYGGKEKYASKEEQKKHESKETPKKEEQEAPKKKIVLGKKKEEVNAEGNTAATERAYMQEVRSQMQKEKEDKEKDDNTPVGLARRAKIAENKGNMKDARRLYDAAKRAGLKT